MLPFNSIEKFPASILSNSPQSDIFPNMVRISSVNSAHTIQPPIQKGLDKPKIPHKSSTESLLALGLATLGGFAIGRGTAQMTERPIDNLPAGLIGATICGAGIIGTIGFYIAKYGGFLDKDRDFKSMFKNL